MRHVSNPKAIPNPINRVLGVGMVVAVITLLKPDV
jgi:hypothetical protein